jgi:hypothetical protein
MNYATENGVIREPAQVMMHLPENWTQVLLLRTYGLGMADGGIYWDIPTEVIPPQLRSLGSRFVITPMGKAQNPPLHGRESRYENIQIEELPEAERSLWPECNQFAQRQNQKL